MCRPGICLLILAVGLCVTVDVTDSASYTYPSAAISLVEKESALYKFLFEDQNYEKAVRPADMSTGATWVSLDIAFHQLIDMNEIKQIFTASLWKRMKWKDYRLRWDHMTNASYYSLTSIAVTNDLIWVPDIILHSDIRLSIRNESKYLATISRNGMISFNTPVVYKSPCSLNMANFPFDEQSCALKFGSWAYDTSAINLVNISASADLSRYERNSELALTGMPLKRSLITYTCCAYPFADITYSMNLRRMPLFYQFNLVIPCLSMILVIMFSFRLPPESGERVSLGITIVLALSVFLQLVGEHTPSQSESIPLIGMYFAVIIIMASVASIGSILIMVIHFNGKRGDPMSNIFRILVLKWIATIVFLKDWANVRVIKDIYLKKEIKEEKSPNDLGSCIFEDELDSLSGSLAQLRERATRGKSGKLTTEQIDTMMNMAQMAGRGDGQQLELVNSADSPLGNLARPLRDIGTSMKTLEEYIWSVIRQEAVDQEWESAGFVIDRFFFILFITGCIIATIVLLAIMPPFTV